MSDMKLSEVFSLAKEEASKEDVGIKAILSSAFSSVGKFVVAIPKAITITLPKTLANAVVDVSNKHDDNIYVPMGKKTLIGDSFESLYTGYEVKEYTASNGNTFTAIESTSSYNTEMVSSDLIGSSPVEYDVLSDDRKAAYEITLLSKKYANMYTENLTDNEKISQEYSDKMCAYREYCETQGISWNRVVQLSSSELQAESYVHSEEAKGFMFSTEAEGNRVLSNKAHSILKSCTSDCEDTLPLFLEGKITYEETLDTSPDSVGFFNNVKTWFTEKWQAIKEAMPHPWQSIKNAVGGYVTNLEDNHYGKDDNQQSVGVSNVSTATPSNRNVDFLTDYGSSSQTSASSDFSME